MTKKSCCCLLSLLYPLTELACTGLFKNLWSIFWIWATEEGWILLRCACDWFGYWISLVVAHDLNHRDDAGCQGVPGIRRVTVPITDYLGPTCRGGFIVCWMVVRYYSWWQYYKYWGLRWFSGEDVRELAIIYCNALIVRSCSYPIENWYDRDGDFTTLSRSSIAWRAASVEEKTGMGYLHGNNLIVFANRPNCVSGTYTV